MGRIWTGNNRAPWHDYAARCVYHFTLMKRHEAPSFGSLVGDWRLPIGIKGSSYVRASNVGKAIKDSLREIHLIHPALRLFQYALMPDHLHMILSAEERLDEIIGRKLAAFKVGVNKRTGIEQVFERGFNDQILTRGRSLDVLYQYLKANPYRLAVRRANPDYFEQSSFRIIGGIPCQLYGNHHLLDNPFKDRVIVHTDDNAQVFSMNRDRWLYTVLNGGVLVSPFISKREKSIRTDAEAYGGRLILISNRPLAEREKPSGKDFNLCTEGRMLRVAPTILPPSDRIYRSTCLLLNSIASAIALGLY